MGISSSVAVGGDKVVQGKHGAVFGVADIRMLVVGTGNSGKSTILKQLKILMMNGFSIDELKLLRPNIFESMVSSMNSMTKCMKDMNIAYACQERLVDADASNSLVAQNVDRCAFTVDAANTLTDLWGDTGLQSAFTNQSENIHLASSTKYLFDNLTRIKECTYVPSYQDILECRTTTAGAVRMDFDHCGLQFSITDVGGQRNIRKKWPQFFGNVEGVIFVVALSEYDQAMHEDASVNRIHDSLDAFCQLVNNPILKDTPIILLFNKKDLFRQKLNQVPLNVCFKEYKGGPNFESACSFVSAEFLKQVIKNGETVRRKGTVYPFFTHATSSEEIKFVIECALNIMKTKMFYSAHK